MVMDCIGFLCFEHGYTFCGLTIHVWVASQQFLPDVFYMNESVISKPFHPFGFDLTVRLHSVTLFPGLAGSSLLLRPVTA